MSILQSSSAAMPIPYTDVFFFHFFCGRDIRKMFILFDENFQRSKP
jgi:hypothetical protein